MCSNEKVKWTKFLFNSIVITVFNYTVFSFSIFKFRFPMVYFLLVVLYSILLKSLWYSLLHPMRMHHFVIALLRYNSPQYLQYNHGVFFNLTGPCRSCEYFISLSSIFIVTQRPPFAII